MISSCCRRDGVKEWTAYDKDAQWWIYRTLISCLVCLGSLQSLACPAATGLLHSGVIKNQSAFTSDGAPNGLVALGMNGSIMHSGGE